MLEDDIHLAHETLYSPEHHSPVGFQHGRESPTMVMNKVAAAGLITESFTFYQESLNSSGVMLSNLNIGTNSQRSPDESNNREKSRNS